MERLTTDNPKNNLQTALNLFYAKDGEAWVRGGGPEYEYQDVPLIQYIRSVIQHQGISRHLWDELDNETLAEVLTEWLFDGHETKEGIIATLYTAAWAFAELRARLKAYEDTGLTPGEVASLQKKLQYAQEERDVVTKRMIEFDTANAQGRLMVLPCKPGDTVFVAGKGKIVECTADVFAIESNGTCAHVYFECDNVCDGCPFNSWHQEPCGEYSCNGEYGDGSVDLNDFGKTVFLTREEAEAKLREGKSDA